MAEYSGGRRGGLNIRLLIGLGLALFAIISYFMKTEVNPVTGEKQRIGMSVEQERALGLQAAPEMAEKMGGVVEENDPGAILVRDVGQRIVAKSDAASSKYADNFNFHLLRDPETINAFALPGGQIFITRGLFDKLDDESQLAGVLGHETGHVIARHSAEQMAKGQLGQMLVTAVAVGASDDRGGRGQFAAMAAMMANQMVQLHYGRDDESQADALGFKYMVESGYDPRGLLGVMRVLAEASKGAKQPEMLSSHPLAQTRVDAINKLLEQQFPNGVPDSLTKGRSLR